MSEKTKTIENDIVTFLIAIVIYFLIGLIVWKIFSWIQIAPADEKGFTGAMSKFGRGIKAIYNFVITMFVTAIILAISAGLLKYNNLRNGFILCGVVSLIALAIIF